VTDIEIDDAGRFCGQRTIKTSIKTLYSSRSRSLKR
jgi:hypothetical protein